LFVKISKFALWNRANRIQHALIILESEVPHFFLKIHVKVTFFRKPSPEMSYHSRKTRLNEINKELGRLLKGVELDGVLDPTMVYFIICLIKGVYMQPQDSMRIG